MMHMSAVTQDTQALHLARPTYLQLWTTIYKHGTAKNMI